MITINNTDYISVTYASFLSNDFNCLKKFDLSVLEKKNYAFIKKIKDNYNFANSIGLKTNTVNLYFTKNWLEGYLNEKIQINQKYLDLIKASKCKCEKRRNTCKNCNGEGVCEHGKHRYRCIECKGGSICEHKRNKYTCKECKGTGVCEHNKIRICCVECNGSQICIYKTRKNICKICDGSQVCNHKKQRQFCKECEGGSICIHNNYRYYCKECKGTGVCSHNRVKSTCKDCGGTQICFHNKRRQNCRECEGSSFCEHGRLKFVCKECGGNGICIHNKIKAQCVECDGSKICPHKKQRNHCGKCKGSEICVTPLCETHKHKKYGNLCAFCFFSNPENADHPRMINYKTKERSTAEFIIETFSEITWISDKKILDGCSKKRPDLFADFGDHIIIIEIDEDRHFNYTCENKRICQLSQDVSMRPITFIRFNPDSYEINDNKIKSPWKKNKFGKLKLVNQQEWDIRLKILKNTVLEVINQPSYKIINVLQLFF